MDATDLLLLRELELGLPLVPEPFAELGTPLGLSGSDVLDRIRRLKSAGLIRKIRARIDQRKVGITANALVAWKPSEDGTHDMGGLLAVYPSVTHCYERRPVPGRWEFTCYTVHHGYSREQVQEEVKAIAVQTGCYEYAILFSTREFKRVPNAQVRENGGDQ